MKVTVCQSSRISKLVSQECGEGSEHSCMDGAGRVSGRQMCHCLPRKEVFKQKPSVGVCADGGEE